MQVKIENRHCIFQFGNCTHCPMAIAFQEQYPEKGFVYVGLKTVATAYRFYEFEYSEWNASIWDDLRNDKIESVTIKLETK